MDYQIEYFIIHVRSWFRELLKNLIDMREQYCDIPVDDIAKYSISANWFILSSRNKCSAAVFSINHLRASSKCTLQKVSLIIQFGIGSKSIKSFCNIFLRSRNFWGFKNWINVIYIGGTKNVLTLILLSVYRKNNSSIEYFEYPAN